MNKNWILHIVCFLGSVAVAFGQSEQLHDVDVYLQNYLSKVPVPGFSIAIVQGDQVIFKKGYGIAVEGKSDKMTPNSILPIGALGRGFTSMAIMQLVEEGKLDLDKPIIEYIPWFRTANKDFSDLITLRMCLSNTSGIPPQYESLPSLDGSEALEEFIRSFDAHIIKRRPGLSHEFCDEGYSIAGYMISKVSGLSYHDYINEHILRPLNMNNSSAHGPKGLRDVIHGHEMGLMSCVRAEANRPDPNYAAAGSQYYSTVDDLSRYMIALLNEGKYKNIQILSPESLTELFKANTSFEGLGTMLGGNGIDIKYALGWMDMAIEERPILIHTGGNGNVASIIGINRRQDQAFVMLFNADVNRLDRFEYPGMENTVNNVIHLLNAEDTTDFGVVRSNLVTEEDYDLPKAAWSKYVGRYESFGKQNPLFTDRSIVVEEDNQERLLLTVHQEKEFKGQYELDFTNESRAVLRNISQPRTIQFTIYPDGLIGGLFMFGSEFKKIQEGKESKFEKIYSPDSQFSFMFPKSIDHTWISPTALEAHGDQFNLTINLTKLQSMSFDEFVTNSLENAEVTSRGILNKLKVKKGIWTEQAVFTQDGKDIKQHLFALYQDPISGLQVQISFQNNWGTFNSEIAEIIQQLQRSLVLD